MLSQAARSTPSTAPSELTGITVTATDLNPVVQIVTWLLLALASLMLCFRILTNFFLKAGRTLGTEDILIFSAYAFGVAESVSMVIPGSTIFGRDMAQISSAELRTGLKIGYSRDLLLILSIGLAKLSVNAAVLALSPDRKHRQFNWTLGSIITLWILTSFFVTAFQCGSRGPWDTDDLHCINQHAFYQYIGITNILTDVGLMALPIAIIWPLRMPWTKLATAMAFFLFRILIVAATIAQLVYIPRLFDENWTLHAWPYFICTQLVQFCSVSAACIVYFLPFIRSLQSGLPWSTGTAFASSYALARRTKPTNDGSNEAHAPWPSSEGRNYVKITTESQIVSRPISQELGPVPMTNATLYPPTW